MATAPGLVSWLATIMLPLEPGDVVRAMDPPEIGLLILILPAAVTDTAPKPLMLLFAVKPPWFVMVIVLPLICPAMVRLLESPVKLIELLLLPEVNPFMVTALVLLSLMNTPPPAIVFPVVAVTALALV